MPRYFHRYYPAAEVDVVELDPDILHVAGSAVETAATSLPRNLASVARDATGSDRRDRV